MRATEALEGKLQGVDEILASALDALVTSLGTPSALSPRPALFLLGYIASSTAMLEHAVWSASHRSRDEHEVDIETLVRWVKGGDFTAARKELSMVDTFDHEVNGRIVYGSNGEARGKL